MAGLHTIMLHPPNGKFKGRKINRNQRTIVFIPFYIFLTRCTPHEDDDLKFMHCCCRDPMVSDLSPGAAAVPYIVAKTVRSKLFVALGAAHVCADW